MQPALAEDRNVFIPKDWVEEYEYMEYVYKNESYKQKYNSFTDWLQSYAEQRGCSKATLWHRLRAGRYYESYSKRCLDDFTLTASLRSAKLNPDCINLVDRIAGDDLAVADDLLTKLIRKEIGHKELKLMWDTVKQQRQKNNEKSGRANSYDKSPVKYYEATTDMKILQALKIGNWAKQNNTAGKGKLRLLNAFKLNRFDEIAPFDVLGVETGKEGIVFHAIDFMLDANIDFSSYARIRMLQQAIDYFWVVLDANTPVVFNVSCLDDACGIILYDSYTEKIKVSRLPQRFYVNTTSALRIALMEEVIKSTI